MDESLEPFAREIDELEERIRNARVQADAGTVAKDVRETLSHLARLEEDIRNLKRKLHTMSWRFQSLPESEGQRAVVHPAPAYPWDDLASSTYMQKGWNCIASGDYPNALKYLELAVKASPGDVKVLSALGWAQTLSQEYDRALLTYQQVLTTEPQNALALVNLGYICLKKRIFGEAIEHLSKALKGGSDRKANLYGNYYLGLVYLAREMHSDAVTFFEKAIELGPAMSEAYFQLGRAHYLAGRRKKAVDAWQKGTAANQFDPWAKRCAEAQASVEAGGRPKFD